jgi:alpha-L-fucosidase 2
MMAGPPRQMPCQTAGDLLLTFPEPKSVGNYHHKLNIDTTIGRIDYTVDGVRFSGEIFSSPIDQVIHIRLTAHSRQSAGHLEREPVPALG